MIKLEDSVLTLPFVGPSYAKRLEKLGINIVLDLLLHVPSRYLDFRKTTSISALGPNDTATVKGTITESKNQYTRRAMKIQIITVDDGTGSINAIWFNQPYLANTLKVGMKVSLAGTVGWWGRTLGLISPEYELFGSHIHTGRLIPVYHETSGVTSKWLRRRITDAMAKTKPLDPLSQSIRKEHNLLELSDAINKVHFPASEEDAVNAKRRLAFDELLLLHLASLARKKKWAKNKVGQLIKIDSALINGFFNSLPFTLTSSQKQALNEILKDLRRSSPMNRLLEGDVGSGKTVVAATGIFASFSCGFQSIIMAPTQILATQHFQTLSQIFAPFKVRLSLLTSGSKVKDKGRIDVFVGTHTLIHKHVDFEKVGFVVIDEQHKFGVEQRTHLIKKTEIGSFSPHVLTMTATPIPRTVAQTFYGDLDLSTLTELPKGRQNITTWLVPPAKREGAYNWINSQITNNKSQAFIVCPLIEESDKETMKDVKAVSTEFAKLKSVFAKRKLGLLHGRLKSSEKEIEIEKFRQGKTDILVTTPVVEVGIDVPNASIMVIEAAERFGLAQLHQLRGRVGRGSKKSYCLAFATQTSQKILTRLTALTKTLSGFELAELDLSMRGPGEIFGTRQSGFPELKIASWQDTDLIISTRKLAQSLVKLGHDTITKKETY